MISFVGEVAPKDLTMLQLGDGGLPMHISLRALTLSLFLVVSQANATSYLQVQKRVSSEVEQGHPVVIHVVVALCDNLHQGIVPVPAKLGNGQDPRSNLYWGAAFGVRTFLSRKAGYDLLRPEKPDTEGILERVVLRKEIQRSGKGVPVYVVADAWDGRFMQEAIARFLEYAAGRKGETLSLAAPGKSITLEAGGHATLVAFVGHNGLMDFPLEFVPKAAAGAQARSSIVLACASRPYFESALESGGSQPLLLTTGLMAPEAYSLEAAISTFVAGAPINELRRAAAAAYNRYQKCGQKAARRLFSAE